MVLDPGRIALPFALLAPPLAWMTFEYGLTVALRPACGMVGWLGPAWGGGAVLACLLALFASRRAIEDRASPASATGRWMAYIAMLGAGVFTLAIVFQTLATLIVPPCAR